MNQRDLNQKMFDTIREGKDGAADRLRRLLSDGAHVTAHNGSDETPLIVAAAYGRMDLIKILLDHRPADHINLVRHDGCNALMTAIWAEERYPSMTEAATLFVDAGTDLDHREEDGRTAQELMHSLNKSHLWQNKDDTETMDLFFEQKQVERIQAIMTRAPKTARRVVKLKPKSGRLG